MISTLRRLAAEAPVPVFALAGDGANDAVQDLRLERTLRVVDAPSTASVLLIAGELREDLVEAARLTHDQLAHPRSTVLWGPERTTRKLAESFPEATAVESDVVTTIGTVYRRLLAGALSSDPPLLPDSDVGLTFWRGIGPYGQGGEGMMGGKPYGRPMTDRADDRDGLTLDQLPLRVGPFFPALPPGLQLDVKLQGDVIQEVASPVEVAPGAQPRNPFLTALYDPVPIAELELARARSHLRRIADALRVGGLDALGIGVLRIVRGLGPGDVDLVSSLRRRIRRSGFLGWTTAGVGVIENGLLEEFGAGPNARAAGLTQDARSDDPAYLSLGFEPVTERGSDVAARWRQRLAEVVQALELAGRAGDLCAEPRGWVESTRGGLSLESHPTGRLLPLLPRILEGLEWGDAVTSLVSLDLDPDCLGELVPGGVHEDHS